MEATKHKHAIHVCQDISNRNFHEFYTVLKKCYGRGDFFELRQIHEKKTQKTLCAKIYRKLDFAEGLYHVPLTNSEISEKAKSCCDSSDDGKKVPVVAEPEVILEIPPKLNVDSGADTPKSEDGKKTGFYLESERNIKSEKPAVSVNSEST